MVAHLDWHGLRKGTRHMHHHAPHATAYGRASTAPASASWLPDARQIRDVYRLIYLHVGNREEAEELTERACVQAVRTAQHDTPAGVTRQRLSDLLSGAARAVIEEHQRRFYGSSVDVLFDDALEAQLRASEWEHDRATTGAPWLTGSSLARLSPPERDVLNHRFFHAASLAETAARMHISADDSLALQWAAVQHAARLIASAGPGPRSGLGAPDEA